MGILTRLAYSIMRIGLLFSVIGAIAVHGFHVVDWKILGIDLNSILTIGTHVASIAALMIDLILEPGLASETADLTKQAFLLAEEKLTDDELLFANEVVDAAKRFDKARLRVSVAVAIAAYYLAGHWIDGLWAEYVAFAILRSLPAFLSSFPSLSASVRTLYRLDPDITEFAARLYQSVFDSLALGEIMPPAEDSEGDSEGDV